MLDYNKICTEICNIAKEAATFIRGHAGNINADVIENKSQHDLVTFVDKGAEKIIVDRLKLLIPESGFLAEEGTDSIKGELYNWIIDPLDGTTNFIHGLSPFAVSIALQEGDETVIGVVYELSLDECFSANKGDCSRLNGNKIECSTTNNFHDSLIATGFPFRDYSKLDEYLKTLTFFIENTRGIRRMGSAATDLVYLAAGRFDTFFEYALKPWDVAAGAFIVQRAGGIVSDFTGNDDYIFGEQILASNAYLYDEALLKMELLK
jgi:myo-inositol-1(or 4)-monophosphatase